MKKSKLKAEIAKLEAEKAELKKDIYLLVDATNKSEVNSLKDHYRHIRIYQRNKEIMMMFGQSNSGGGLIIKHKTGIITHIGEV